MFPWGAIIGLAGQEVSGALSITNNRRMQQEADAEAARQKAFYEAKANENPLSRSEVLHVLGQYDRSAQQQIENARSMAAIKGSTPEFAAAVQKGVAEGRANLMGQVAAGASRRADYYNMLGEQAQHQKAQEDMQRRMQRNSTYAALAGNAASAVGAIMDGYSAQQAKAPAEIKVSETPEQNHSKLASATPPPTQSSSPIPHQNPVGVTTGEANAGFTANADGTFTKDGQIYVKGYDEVFRLKQ